MQFRLYSTTWSTVQTDRMVKLPFQTAQGTRAHWRELESISKGVWTMAVSEVSSLGLLDSLGSITATLTLSFILMVGYLVFSYLKPSDTWEKYGVKHVTLEQKEMLIDYRKACHKAIKQYGDTIGTHHYGKMYLITTNAELIKAIMAKDFNSFVDRDMNLISTSPLWKGLIFRGKQDWRRLRQIWTPCFSPGKIKGCLATVCHSAQRLTTAVEEYSKKGQLIPAKRFSGQYSAQIIAKLAFGLDTDCIGREDDEFTHYSLNFARRLSDMRQMVTSLLFRTPKVYRFLIETLKVPGLDPVNKDADVYFNSVLHRTIAERREFVRSGKKLHNDFLQSFVVAKEEGDKAVADAAKEGSSEALSRAKSIKTMTEAELIGQAMLVNLAGFETTATTLQFLLYLLAKYPDVQDKVMEEIESVVQSDVPTYEEIGELKYIDQVISETLRLFPPGPLLTRKALETRTYGNITIPKGAAVVMPVDLVMTDPKHYEDPEKFDPDRFSEEKKAERDPVTFLSFGFGPRLCPGIRLAFMEIKVGLVSLIRKIKLELDEKAKHEKLNVKYQVVVSTEKPIMLTAKLRS